TPPSKVDPAIRKEVSALVEMMMAKDPDDRYADPDELIEAVDAAISGRPAPATGARRSRQSAAAPSTARARKGTSTRRLARSRSPKEKGALLVPAAVGGGGVVVAAILIAIFAFSGPSGVHKTDERLRHAELLLQEGTPQSLDEALAISRRVARTLPAGDAYERLRDRADRIGQLVERKILDAEKERMKDLVEGVGAGRTTADAAEAAVAALETRYGEEQASAVLRDCISRLCNLTRGRLTEARAQAGGKTTMVAGRGPHGGLLDGGPGVRETLGGPSRPKAPEPARPEPPKRSLAEIKAEIPEGSAIAVVLPDIEKHLAAGEFVEALGMIDVIAETVEGKERSSARAVSAHVRGEAERAFAEVVKDVRSYIEVERFDMAEAELKKAKGKFGFAPYAGKIDAELATVRRRASARPVAPAAPPGMVTEPAGRAGTILVELWWGIPGRTVADLTRHPRYPGRPMKRAHVSILECPRRPIGSFGTRIRGFLHPPATGEYRFWIAADDSAELWVSTDDTPANRRKIAHVGLWTGPREWEKKGEEYRGQRSPPVRLVAGRKYYVEVLHKEAPKKPKGKGRNHVAVGWRLPDGSYERPIPGGRLSPWTGATAEAGGEPTPGAIATRPERIGGALEFDGVDDYVDLPDGFADFTGGFTVALWAYPTAVRKWGRFIDIAQAAGANRTARSGSTSGSISSRRSTRGAMPWSTGTGPR
ncbi:MAG: PA14 domain-containing protein, partial [Planctomycetota bacterium]